ncbi:MAG: cytidylate kinase [Planctomycetaceae bacterium]|nr:MAG: cytidylate kinase [Planctomycetaceae bacterium]
MHNVPRGLIITIDGPAGTGKSTLARQLAEHLGLRYLNTGLMYRAVGYVCAKRDIAPQAVAKIVEMLPQLDWRIEGDRFWLEGLEITSELHQPRVAELASIVAAHPEVRQQLVRWQQQIGLRGGVVSEGRDQGTVVFPEADHKFYLTARPEVRARRRQSELEARGVFISYEQILQEQYARDERDRARPASPLQPAVDAIIIDTSELSPSEVLQRMVNEINCARKTS